MYIVIMNVINTIKYLSIPYFGNLFFKDDNEYIAYKICKENEAYCIEQLKLYKNSKSTQTN